MAKEKSNQAHGSSNGSNNQTNQNGDKFDKSLGIKMLIKRMTNIRTVMQAAKDFCPVGNVISSQ